MNFGSSQPATTTTKQELSPEQQELLGLAMPKLREFAASTPKLAAGVAGFTDPQKKGQAMALDAAGDQAGVVGSAAGASKRLTSGEMLSPSSNPALQKWIDAAVLPINQQFTETTLPAIRSEALLTNNVGGSREGIAQGLAARGAAQAVGSTTANIANEGYKSGLDAMTKALGFAPTTAQSLTMPASTTNAVGDVQQAQAQRELDTQNQIANYEEWLPYIQGSALAGASSGIRGGSATTTAQAPKADPFTQALGTAATVLPFFL